MNPYAECFRQMSTVTSIDDMIRLYTGEGVDAECPWGKKGSNDVNTTATESELSVARQLGMTTKNVQQAKQLSEVRGQHAQRLAARPLTDAEQLAAALGITPAQLAEHNADARTLSEKVTAKFAGKS